MDGGHRAGCALIFLRRAITSPNKYPALALPCSRSWVSLLTRHIYFLCRPTIKEEKTITINKTQNGTALTIALEGRLDTMTAPELEAELKKSLDGMETLTLDFSKLDYISSAGLRVLLSAHKLMSAKGGMKVTNVNDVVQEVFEVTGFADILTIE